MFFGRKVWATVASSNASGSFDCVWRKAPNSAQDDKRKTSNRRSFDCASRDETARSSAQDDSVYLFALRSLRTL